MVKTNLLTFEAFRQRVVFEGFDEETLRGLGMFMAQVTAGEADDTNYRVVAGGRPRRPADAPSRMRRPWSRHIRREGEDILVMPGGRVRLAPGRTEAMVELSGATFDPFVTTSLLGP